ncbi:MAG: hypothetical protein ACRESK_09255 [Gammaproteobacteria bacterium]
MAYTARKMNYCYVTVNHRAGASAAILEQIKKAGINLLAFSGFPTGGGKAQIDLVADRLGGIQKLAKKYGWKVSRAKKGFLIQGSDEVGAIEKHVRKLAQANINVTAADAVAAGKGRYGMILWVRKKDYNRAAKALGAK